MAGDADELVEIVVDGLRYRDWQTVSMTRDFNSVQSYCVFTAAAPIESGKSAGFSGQRLKNGQRCQVMMGGFQVANGLIKARQPAFDAYRHGLQIQVLSLTSHLAETAVNHRPGEYKNYGFKQLAGALAKEAGVGLVMEGDLAGADRPFPRFNVRVGETILSAIARLARMRNLFLTDDAQGRLVAYRKPKNQAAIAELQEGRNIKSANLIQSNHLAAGEVEVLAQSAGNDQRSGKRASQITSGKIRDPLADNTRRKVLISEEPGDQRDLEDRAFHELAQSHSTLIQGSIVVQGWRAPTGRNWVELLGKTIDVYSPMLFPDDRMLLAIQGVNLRQVDGGGTETEINLCHPSGLNGAGGVKVNPAAT